MTIHVPRHWFTFSLRTMFVGVTVFVCWFGYQLNWIRQRHELLGKISDTSPPKDFPVCHNLWLSRF
jgi:hypothetical protein